MSPSLALQHMIRARLVADPAVLALVPANDIADRHGRPARFPSITLGEGREYRLGSVSREASRVVVDLHVWTDTAGTAQSKAIADAVRRAVRHEPWTVDQHMLMEFRYEGSRFMADPGSTDTTHGVMSFEAHMVEAA